MKDNDIPITRENYMSINAMNPQDEWGPEQEEQVPHELQDWSQFKDRR